MTLTLIGERSQVGTGEETYMDVVAPGPRHPPEKWRPTAFLPGFETRRPGEPGHFFRLAPSTSPSPHEYVTVVATRSTRGHTLSPHRRHALPEALQSMVLGENIQPPDGLLWRKHPASLPGGLPAHWISSMYDAWSLSCLRNACNQAIPSGSCLLPAACRLLPPLL